MADKADKKQKIAQYKARKITGGVFCIRNTQTGKSLLMAERDVKGSQNRFAFSQMTGSCVHMVLQQDWKTYGAQAFAFEVLEELEKKEDQTDREFDQDLQTLLEMWREKFSGEELYNKV